MYLVAEKIELAKRVADDMRLEDRTRLQGMWNHLDKVAEREFWEVNDRGVNFDWLTPEQKQQLPRFFAWFDNVRLEDHPDHNKVRV